MTLPNKETHDPINWLLTRKRISEGKNMGGQPAKVLALDFTCQECGEKYTRLVDPETFDNAVVEKTAWEWGWTNGD
jgi:hypothetical protein